VQNILVFILYAFSWGIILGLKFNTHLKSLLDTEANEALNNKKSVETYDFNFGTIKVGRSLWPLAVASLLALMVSMYLLIILCCDFCKDCKNCNQMMRCKCDDYKNPNEANEDQCNRNSTIEMAGDGVQV
jgi:hypothetical protein